MPSLAEITVVVPTRNEADNVAAFLASLPAQVRLVVVDNSDDSTVALIQRIRPQDTRIIHFTGTLTEARQVGADAAETPWLLFTDADLCFDETYFAELAGLDGDTLYGPKLSRNDYRRYYQAFAWLQGCVDWLGAPAASGSNLAVKRQALRAVGGFDLRLTCNEDSELVWRLKRRGYTCRFVPALRVWATDHRRLRRGRLRKTLHTIVRCSLLYTGLMPDRWRRSDWGYWKGFDSRV